MSGHSKWATIHRQKEVKDAKRGAAFTKLGAAITVAVREGGGVADPNQNFKLRLAVDQARQMNMPKENIQRAIDRAAGGAGAELTEVEYEGFLPGGAAVVAVGLSDNKLRTSQQVREVLDKGGGSLAGSGAVGYMFDRKGEVVIKPLETRVKSQEDQELELIDLGAEDIDKEGDSWVVYCSRDDTYTMKEKLAELGYKVESADLTLKPNTAMDVESEPGEKAMAILEKLQDLDDIHKVYTNANFLKT